MKIVSFMYCEDIQNDPNGKNIVIGPMQMIIPVAVPTNYSFNVTIGLFDVKTGDDICARFIDVNGEVVSESRIVLPDLVLPNGAEKLPVGLQLNFGFRNIILKTYGEYKTEVYLNGVLCNSYPIEVVNSDTN